MSTEKSQKCTWEEHDEKRFLYVPGCLHTPVNIFKLSKRTGKTIASIMMKCLYCGRKVEFIFK